MDKVYTLIGGRRNAGRIAHVEHRIDYLRRKVAALELMEAAGVISPDIYRRGGLNGVRADIEYYKGDLHALEDYLKLLKR